jgi:phage/plasmid-like protein (TIGR03299 family)
MKGDYPKITEEKMAHELEIINGNASMFFRGENPWHRLGTFIHPDEKLTAEQAIVAANLDWTANTKQLFLADGTPAPANAVVRSDNNAVLGVVGKDYQPLQNRDAFRFFDSFIESNQAQYETAGALRDGKRIWVLAKINSDVDVVKGNDILERYVLLSNSHDGTTAVRAGFTNIRVVCQNTLSIAHSSANSRLIRVRHGRNVKDNLDRVSEIMNLANREFEATLEQYKLLANRQINSTDLEKYVKLVMVGAKKMEANEEAGNRIINRIIPLFEKGRGNDMPEIKGTFWAAYNSISEYLQYEKGSDEQIRMDSLMFGQSSTVLENALKIAMKMAA